MKTSLKVAALFLAASVPSVAFAEMLGAHISPILSVDNVAIGFALLIISLTIVTDYTRRSRTALAHSYEKFVSNKGETHRLAA